ncbi:hypothetical protein XENORESO_011624 [Xenotaenia resolanae]|uniref:Uncharacterized protein n=1 Tax=Xenotaenia resolanae TaxID=208358 RepID=A0ABV0WE70_9TELE
MASWVMQFRADLGCSWDVFIFLIFNQYVSELMFPAVQLSRKRSLEAASGCAQVCREGALQLGGAVALQQTGRFLHHVQHRLCWTLDVAASVLVFGLIVL